MNSHIEEDLSELSCDYDQDSEQDWSDDDIISDTGTNASGRFRMDELLADSIEVLGDKINYKPDNGHLELNFDTSKIPLPVKQALGLADVDKIIIELMFDSLIFGAGMAPRSELRLVKQEVPPAELQVSCLIQSAAAEPAYAPVSPGSDVQEQPTEVLEHSAENSEDPADFSDSESDAEEVTHLPKRYKRPVLTGVAYQVANIAKKKLEDDWQDTKHATWKQANNWIPQLHRYLAMRLTTLGDYCIVCDNLQPMPGIKPVACSKALCSHQFDEMGFGASMDIIYNSPTVADLLISMAAAAASNPYKQHRQRFFACPNPPSDFVAGRTNTADPDDNMCIQWEELQQVLAELPAVGRMAAAKDLQRFLNKYHQHAYRLVRWILSTCRGHIAELDPTQQIQGMGGRQFKLFTNTFERELAFQKLKQQQQGSFFVFHGSPFMKWHSIMRTCLQNFSNTPYMTSGASYGSGVYTATAVGTSVAYSSAGSCSKGYRASVFGGSAACLALVEVAGTSADPSGIHVVQNHDGVAARYFFVYNSSSELPTHMHTNSMSIPAWDVSKAC